MLKKSKNKLKNLRGASLVIALLVFLLAVLTGTAVITMAKANIGRYTDTKRQQQAYLNVASAVNLVRSQLKDFFVTATGTCSADEKITLKSPVPKGSELFKKMSSLLSQCSEYLNRSVQIKFLQTDASDLSEKTVRFSLDVQGSSVIKQVLVVLTIDGALGLTFDFSCGDGADGYSTQMTVRPIEEQIVVQHDTDNVTYTQNFRWDAEHAIVRQTNS